MTTFEEHAGAAWRWLRLERLGHDLRYAIRIMRRRPALAAAAVATLALGIGGNTAVFSLIDALLLRTLPVDRPEQSCAWSNAAQTRRPIAKRSRT